MKKKTCTHSWLEFETHLGEKLRVWKDYEKRHKCAKKPTVYSAMHTLWFCLMCGDAAYYSPDNGFQTAGLAFTNLRPEGRCSKNRV